MTEFLKKNDPKVYLIIISFAVIITLCFKIVSFKTDKETENSIEKVFSGIEKTETIAVVVCGEVLNEGTYVLKKGANVGDAVEAAGGFSENANKNINRVFAVKDGSTVKVMKKTQNANAGIDFKININTAGAKELMTLEGIGPKTAENIVKYREENGKFQSVDDIARVKGIGQKIYEKIKDTIITG